MSEDIYDRAFYARDHLSLLFSGDPEDSFDLEEISEVETAIRTLEKNLAVLNEYLRVMKEDMQ